MAVSKVERRLINDINQFYEDPEGYVLFAFPWGEGELESHPDGPDTWQREQMREIRNQILEDPDTYVLRFATATGHGVGKALSINEQIPTPSGYVNMGALSVGDFVFGRNGQPTKVTGVFPQGVREMYRITFDDGSTIDASPDHLWTVKGRAQRRYGEGHHKSEWITLTTQEIIDAGVKRKNGSVLAREWEIPVHQPIEFQKKELPLSPYAIGVMIGDGDSNGRYTSVDQEVTDRISKEHKVTTHTHSKNSEGVYTSHCLHGAYRAMKQLGLCGCRAWEKYIPDDIKFNTAQTRHDCLVGLMDTDGYIDERGICTYTTTSKRLADDVVWMCRSLGIKARRQKTIKKPFYRCRDNEKVVCRDAYIVTITASVEMELFTISRKKDRRKAIQPRYISRWIDRIEPIPKTDQVCITVEAKDSLFIAGLDSVVTHNSAMVSWLILWFLSTRYPAKGVVTANTLGQLSSKTWAELSKWHNRAVNKHWFEWTATSFYLKAAPKINFMEAAPNSEHNSEAFQGLHQEHVLVIFDEASAIPKIIWEVSDGAMTTPRAMMFVYGNPTQPTGRFFECFGRLKHRWTTRSIDSRTCKMTNKQEIAKWAEDNSEDSDFFRIRVRGVFPRQASNQFISSEDVVNAQKREVEPNIFQDQLKVMGVDVARYGADQSVIAVIEGRRLHPLIKTRNRDLMGLASWIVEAIKLHRPDIINIDGVGVGAGVVDRLRQLNYQITEVNGGFKASTPSQENTYYNRRAEMWGEMKDWLKYADIPDDPELHDDLIGPEYSYDNKERIKLETKEHMADRGLNSPDCGDALSHCFFEKYPNVAIQGSELPPEDEF